MRIRFGFSARGGVSFGSGGASGCGISSGPGGGSSIGAGGGVSTGNPGCVGCGVGGVCATAELIAEAAFALHRLRFHILSSSNGIFISYHPLIFVE